MKFKYHRWFQALVVPLVALAFHIFFGYRVIGRENIPEGGCVVCPNHVQLSDPPFAAVALGGKTPIRLMAKKELFDHKMLSPILKIADAFPVSRGSNDIGAIKTALQTLKDGDMFTIFPSGKRVLANESSEAKAGVALIAARSGAPVIPVAMRGGYKPFHQVKIYFGQPVTMKPANGKKPTGDELKAFADEIMEKIESLGV